MRAVKHVRGLDGLRAVAVTLVFLSHRAHFGAVDVGQIGVWTFFLISGFLIVGELHRSRLAIERGASSRRYAFWLFAGKRALRILPVYYLLLAALAIAHRSVYQRGVDLGLRWHAVFLSDYWIGVVKEGWPGSTSHFWSLAVEQQFYLIAPIVLLATRASRHLTIYAAAVALAADTGGSFRIPAAHCGLTGFKPTASRIPKQGGVPLSTTLDSFGPIGVSVACCALVDRILAGLEPHVCAAPPLEGVRLRGESNDVTDGMDAHVATSLDAALKHLEAAGAIVSDARFAPLDTLPGINRIGFASIEAHAWHRPLVARHRDAYDPRVLARILKGEPASAADYLDLVAARAALIDEAARTVWQRFDALVAPTVPIAPPRIAELERDDDAFARTNALVLRNPSAFNFLDACALSLPCHPRDTAPVGLMLAAAPHHDDALLAIGQAVEAVLATIR